MNNCDPVVGLVGVSLVTMGVVVAFVVIVSFIAKEIQYRHLRKKSKEIIAHMDQFWVDVADYTVWKQERDGEAV